jgi:hypothetical protein
MAAGADEKEKKEKEKTVRSWIVPTLLPEDPPVYTLLWPRTDRAKVVSCSNSCFLFVLPVSSTLCLTSPSCLSLCSVVPMYFAVPLIANLQVTLTRNYKLTFVPYGLFSRIIIQIMQLDVAVHVYWRSGMLFSQVCESLPSFAR